MKEEKDSTQPKKKRGRKRKVKPENEKSDSEGENNQPKQKRRKRRKKKVNAYHMHAAYHMLHMTEIYVGFESFRLKYPSGRQIFGLSFPMHSFKYQYGKCS